MDIQKFKHACLVLTKDNQSLVIDPGSWSDDFVCPETVVGVVITHEHADHFNLEKLKEIITKNPNAHVYAHVDIIAQLDTIADIGITVASGNTVTVGNFSPHFTGGTHATIHPNYPVPANLGVVVDDGELYYPGDSFVVPNCPVKTLAVPASAPWLKASEAMDFIMTVKPKTCFPTHNILLSTQGQSLVDTWLKKAADSVGSSYTVL